MTKYTRRQNNFRRFKGDKLLIATHNLGKVAEISKLFKPLVTNIFSAVDLGLKEIEETGSSFKENSQLKALYAAKEKGMPAVADDSGLVVNALNGRPGIFSARWGGESRDFLRAMNRVEKELGRNPDRSAHLNCTLTLAWPDGYCETLTGIVEGELVWPPRGTKGFGYDSMFLPNCATLTFGEMDPLLKEKISHRSHAFMKLKLRCF